jgi:hypothetical protein
VLINHGNFQDWASYGSPAIAAEVGSTFKRLDGNGGTSTCVAKSNLADADYITIGDGISLPKLYEFDPTGNGVTAGRIRVNVSNDTTASEVCARLQEAISSNQPILMLVNMSGILMITNKLAGTFANISIGKNVANPGFLVSGMSGGINAAR